MTLQARQRPQLRMVGHKLKCLSIRITNYIIDWAQSLLQIVSSPLCNGSRLFFMALFSFDNVRTTVSMQPLRATTTTTTNLTAAAFSTSPELQNLAQH